jgi:TfoX/Sxy family transcriptional regulator of competence genes
MEGRTGGIRPHLRSGALVSYHCPTMHSFEILDQILRDGLREASLSTDISARRTLGASGMHLKGLLFAYIAPAGIALKLSPPDQIALLALPGASRYTPGADPTRANQFVQVPEAMLDDKSRLAGWIRKSWTFVERSTPQGRPGSRKTASRLGRNRGR